MWYNQTYLEIENAQSDNKEGHVFLIDTQLCHGFHIQYFTVNVT